MNLTQAQELIGSQVAGRLIDDVQTCGSLATGVHIYLMCDGERVFNATDVEPAALGKLRMPALGNKRARHRVG